MKQVLFFFCLSFFLLAAREGIGATRNLTCDPLDPTGNADVLCSGDPCEVTDTWNFLGDCTLDFGLRTLVVKGKTLEAKGARLEITAGAIVGLKTGSSKATFSVKGGISARGGTLTLTSFSDIDINGVLDASGAPAGNMFVSAVGDITLTGKVRANGKTTNSGGGGITITAGQDLFQNALVSAEGGGNDAGGNISLTARRNLVSTGNINAPGGEFSGGSISFLAGDDITISGNLDASSNTKGGDGGTVDIIAGRDVLGGEKVGGTLTLSGDVNVSPSTTGPGFDAFAGDGGDVFVQVSGDMYVDPAVIVKSQGAGPDGSGGDIFIVTTDSSATTVGPLDGNLEFLGQIINTGLGTDSDGGDVTLSAGVDLTLGKVDVSSKWVSGDFSADAGGAVNITDKIIATGGGNDGDGGLIDVTAGLATLGPIVVNDGADLLAAGGAVNGPSLGGDISLIGCSVDVGTGLTVDSRGGFGSSGRPFGGDITVIAPAGITLRADFQSQHGGKIFIISPSAFPPDITGATFDTTPTIQVAETHPLYPGCGQVPTPTPTPVPVCGNGVVEQGEACDDGNTVDGDCCSSLCQIEPDGSSCPSADSCMVGQCTSGTCQFSPVVDCANLGNVDCNSGLDSADALTELCLFVGICQGADLPAPCNDQGHRLAVGDWDRNGQIDSSDALTTLAVFVNFVDSCSTPLGACCCP